jgi:sulfate adenylyltransferase subunit 2
VTNETLRGAIHNALMSGGGGSTEMLVSMFGSDGTDASRRHVVRLLNEVLGAEALTDISLARDDEGNGPNALLVGPLIAHQRRTRAHLLIAELIEINGEQLLLANDRRGTRWWTPFHRSNPALSLGKLKEIIGSEIIVVPQASLRVKIAEIQPVDGVLVADFLFPPLPYIPPFAVKTDAGSSHKHLHQLEAESIRIIREAVAAAKNPGMLFSMGKDSMVMWALSVKAFFPEPPPFPLAVIDTQWKFRDMYRFRNYIENRSDTNVTVHINPDAIKDKVNPFDFGSARHTEITKTFALKQVLDTHQFDFVFGGARRDEERSRAKERVFSVRNPKHGWDPKSQRPELWNLYNTTLSKSHSMRVFPLSNWTELDIWRYIEQENIPVVPLYFSKVRPFVERDGALIMVDDERFRLEEGERVHFEPIRFRTLGCYPLTGGVRSSATTVADIISELEESRVSERSSRVIDFDPGASMEQKKKEGYF